MDAVPAPHLALGPRGQSMVRGGSRVRHPACPQAEGRRYRPTPDYRRILAAGLSRASRGRDAHRFSHRVRVFFAIHGIDRSSRPIAANSANYTAKAIHPSTGAFIRRHQRTRLYTPGAMGRPSATRGY